LLPLIEVDFIRLTAGCGAHGGDCVSSALSQIRMVISTRAEAAESDATSGVDDFG
jgi:hypothetical protein